MAGAAIRGWRCQQGYQEKGASCVAIRVPANAFAIDSSFGKGWKCERGFRESDESCEADAGNDWTCDEHHLRAGDVCVREQGR